jgi:hypothetical protein
MTPETPVAPVEVGEAPSPAGSEPELPAPRKAAKLRSDEDDTEYDDEALSRRRRRRPDMQPHRGTLILVLAILGFVLCGFLGPVAWIMGNNDLREMRAGRMDPEGEGLTQAGRIIGIITSVLMLLSCCVGILVVAFWAARAAHPGF